MVLLTLRPDYILYRKSSVYKIRITSYIDGFQLFKQGSSFKPACILPTLNHIVTFQSRNGNKTYVGQIQYLPEGDKLFFNIFKYLFTIFNKVHLIHTDQDVRNT